jgi:putative intracellular protease/amidase
MTVQTPTVRQPRVLIVATSHADLTGVPNEKAGLWLSELSSPRQILLDRGARVDVATIEGGMPPFEPRSIDEPSEIAVLNRPELNAALRAAPALRDVDTSGYDAIVLAGGQGALFDYEANPAVQQAMAGVYERGGIASAICHGANGLTGVTVDGKPLVEGRRVTGFSNAEDRFSNHPALRDLMTENRMHAVRADYRAAEPYTSHVEVDGRIITAQNPQSADALGIALADALGLRG